MTNTFKIEITQNESTTKFDIVISDQKNNTLFTVKSTINNLIPNLEKAFQSDTYTHNDEYYIQISTQNDYIEQNIETSYCQNKFDSIYDIVEDVQEMFY